VGGVKYYNSSIDSSPARSRATLSAFSQKVIMIAGGKDKNIPYDSLGEVILKRVKALILIGATADKIEAAVHAAHKNMPEEPLPEIYRCTTYPQVVETAHAIAKPGDIVILSPASTSFDMFNNFEERGKLYKQLVMGIN
jgi:UDP-N-acetylmuramoylalanine--D-glutamate ligase